MSSHVGFTTNLVSTLCLSLSYRHPPKTPLLQQNESPSVVRQRYGSAHPCLAPASKNQVQPSSGCRQGAISPLASPLPSVSLSYPPTTQGPLHHQNESQAAQQRCGYVFVQAYHLQARIRFNSGRDAEKGAISPQISPLPSGIHVRHLSSPRESFEPGFSLKDSDELMNTGAEAVQASAWRRISNTPRRQAGK